MTLVSSPVAPIYTVVHTTNGWVGTQPTLDKGEAARRSEAMLNGLRAAGWALGEPATLQVDRSEDRWDPETWFWGAQYPFGVDGGQFPVNHSWGELVEDRA